MRLDSGRIHPRAGNPSPPGAAGGPDGDRRGAPQGNAGGLLCREPDRSRRALRVHLEAQEGTGKAV